MCSACEFKASQAPRGADEQRRRDGRARQMRLVGGVLAGQGLQVLALPGGRIRLTGRDGAAVLAEGPDAVWELAEALLGRPVDPLDPLFLAPL